MTTPTTTRTNGAAPAALTGHEVRPAGEPGRRVLRAAIWLPGLAVALGAAVATAHGLYEVAAAARVPAGIAWLYPLITDGLALVAYAATARLTGSARRYAWAVVILAAALSGLAQAAYLASDAAAALPLTTGAAPAPAVGFVAPAGLRFGVGAWPAIAAAIAAHLLYLLATDQQSTADNNERPAYGRSVPFDRTTVQPSEESSSAPSTNGHRHAPLLPGGLPSNAQTAVMSGLPDEPSTRPFPIATAPPGRVLDAPARDRARAAARRHAEQHAAWPTTTQLMTLAEVSRGTAGDALKHLRGQQPQANNRTETTNEEHQP